VGCASSHLAARAPPGVRLSGDWKLDPAGSEDLGRALVELRAQDEKERRARARHPIGFDEEGGGEGRESRSEPGESAPEQLHLGPGPHISPAAELMASVPQGEYLRITLNASTFTVTSGASSSQYTTGLESEISAQQGEARQISGWKAAEYVIDTRPQWGPQIIQSYGLTQDGKLRMTVRLSGGGTKFTFTRLYDRTTRVSPLALPTND